MGIKKNIDPCPGITQKGTKTVNVDYGWPQKERKFNYRNKRIVKIGIDYLQSIGGKYKLRGLNFGEFRPLFPYYRSTFTK